MASLIGQDLTVATACGPEYLRESPLTPETVVAYLREADQDVAQLVVDAPVETGDGRSKWFWVRLVDGHLMLACFPQGDTYFETEGDHGRP